MPEVERDELALIYEAKGMDRDHANALATQMMQHPQSCMLEEQVQEELKIGEAQLTPFREGWVTGLATAAGRDHPGDPFLFIHGRAAGWSRPGSMAAHFGVGAARAVFTGRGVFRSGLDMFVVGLGVAVVGFSRGIKIGAFPSSAILCRVPCHPMRADKLLKQGEKTLRSVNDRFGWQGDEDVQAWDILAHVLGRQPENDEKISRRPTRSGSTSWSSAG